MINWTCAVCDTVPLTRFSLYHLQTAFIDLCKKKSSIMSSTILSLQFATWPSPWLTQKKQPKELEGVAVHAIHTTRAVTNLTFAALYWPIPERRVNLRVDYWSLEQTLSFWSGFEEHAVISYCQRSPDLNIFVLLFISDLYDTLIFVSRFPQIMVRIQK